MNLVFSMTLWLTVFTLMTGLVTPVRILITKLKMKDWVLSSANISCVCDNMGPYASEIAALQLLGPGDRMIANLHHNSTISVAKDHYFSKMEVSGNLDEDVWNTHLTLVASQLLSIHSGTYKCVVYYFDRDGFVLQDITSNILDAGKQDLNQIISYVMSTMEVENKQKEQRIIELESHADLQSSKVQGLEDQTANLNKIMKDLVEKGQVCAFRARYNHADTVKSNYVLLFRNVDLNTGDGYNSSTGIFTASMAGLYVFHLTIRTKVADTYVYVRIEANGKGVGMVNAKDMDSYDQSSTSTTVRLEKGDTVKPVVYSTSTTTLYDGEGATAFSGYLVQGL